MPVCAVCSEENLSRVERIKSRLSPDSYLRHDREETGYTIYHYCKSCHLDLLAKAGAIDGQNILIYNQF